MTNKTELKLYALEAIKESTLEPKDKLSLLKEVKDLSLVETMAFLNKGQVYKGEINEDVKKEIKDKFKKNEKLQESITEFEFTKFLHEDMGIAFLSEFKATGSAGSKQIGDTKVWGASGGISGRLGSVGGSVGGIKGKGLTRSGTIVDGSGMAMSGGIGLTKSGQAVAAAAVAAMAAAFAYKIYKRYMTEVGKKCKNFKGPEYTKCANQVKKQGIAQAITKLNQTKSQCAKSKDPAACKAKIDAKIKEFQAKAAKLGA